MSERAYVVIPALNEADRITAVLKATAGTDEWLVDKEAIIVVDNGSRDATIDVASSFTNHVIDCETTGKGHAMDIGVQYAKRLGARVVTFLDADLTGLQGEHIDALSRPVVLEKSLMTVGIMGGRPWLGQTSIIGTFSGQRSLTTNVWDKLSPSDLVSWRTEAALNALFRNTQREDQMEFVYLEGVGQVNKFSKGRPPINVTMDYLRMSTSALRGLWSRAGL